jgi:DNA/RNA-binding domain of Phe-tRNA-synthetase-like protein
MATFRYHPDIFARYPELRAGVVLARGVTNGPAPVDLLNLYADEQRVVRERIGETPLSELNTLSEWRAAFRGFGVNPTKYRSAPEALLRRLTKKGDIPSINTLVDICNLVSIRFALPVAAFDTRAVRGPVKVCFAEGHEGFTPLGRSEVEHPEPGEVIFVDEANMVIARRWCWRQSDESAARPGTSEAIFTTEAQHTGSAGDIQAALDDLLELLGEYAGGSFISGVLDPARLEISD